MALQRRETYHNISNQVIQYNFYYPTLLGEEQLVQIIEGSDNSVAKITGLNGVVR